MAKTRVDNRSSLAQNMILGRKALGWSQQDLADKAGVHVNSIKLIETDESEGHLETRRAIAQALGLTLSDLYRSATEVAAVNLEVAATLLGQLARLRPVRRAIVLYLISQKEDYLKGLPGEAARSALSLVKAL